MFKINARYSLGIMLVLSLLLSSVAAQATMLFQDNFNRTATYTQPAAIGLGWSGVTGSPGYQGSWVANGSYIIETPQPDNGDNLGGQYVSAVNLGTVPLDHYWTVSTDLRRVAGYGNPGVGIFQLLANWNGYDPAVNLANVSAVRLFFDPDGSVDNPSGPATVRMDEIVNGVVTTLAPETAIPGSWGIGSWATYTLERSGNTVRGFSPGLFDTGWITLPDTSLLNNNYAGIYNNFIYDNNYAFAVDNFTITQETPEPSTLALLVLGGVAVRFHRRRKSC